MWGRIQQEAEEIRVTWHRECYGFLETQPKNLCFLLRLDGEGRLQQGACGKLPWAASAIILSLGKS
jgi:hypothetical protein